MLPPLKERPNLSQGNRKVITKLFPVSRATSQKDDLYIYYQAFTSILVVCLCLLPFYLWVFLIRHDLDLGFYRIVAETEKLKSVIKQFNEAVYFLAIWILYPFFMIKLRWNINPMTYDVLAYNYKWDENQLGRNRWKILFFSIATALLAWVVIKYSYWITAGMGIRLFYSETLFSALLFFSIVIAAICITFFLLITSSFIIWRYIGPYKGK